MCCFWFKPHLTLPWHIKKKDFIDLGWKTYFLKCLTLPAFFGFLGFFFILYKLHIHSSLTPKPPKQREGGGWLEGNVHSIIQYMLSSSDYEVMILMNKPQYIVEVSGNEFFYGTLLLFNKVLISYHLSTPSISINVLTKKALGLNAFYGKYYFPCWIHTPTINSMDLIPSLDDHIDSSYGIQKFWLLAHKCC